MKRKLGAIVLTLSALVISASCASSGSSTPQPDSGESWAKAVPSQLRSRTNKATTVHTARPAAR
jgi:hypothetical protein